MIDSTDNEEEIGSGQAQDVAGELADPDANVLPKVCVRLSAARIARGFSQQDIAASLYLSTSHIENIDAGQFEKISKPAFLRGYLRAYARELGLSGDEIVAMYDDELCEMVDETTRLKGVTEQKVGSANFTGPVVTTATYSLLGIALILAAIFWLNPEKDANLSQPSASGADQNTPVTERRDSSGVLVQTDVDHENVRANDSGNGSNANSEAASSPGFGDANGSAMMPDSPVETNKRVPNNLTETEASDAAENGISNLAGGGRVDENELSIAESEVGVAAATNQSVVSHREIVVDRTNDQGIQLIRVSAGGDDHLQFVFTDECWLEVTDAAGELVYGDLNHDRDILDLYGVAPFKILVGKVSAVTVTFNDRAVGFSGVTFNDTAKLVVN